MSTPRDNRIEGMLAGLVLVALAERGSAAVTLATDGLLLSGFLISSRQFHAGIADFLAARGGMGDVLISQGLQNSVARAPTVPPDVELSTDTIPDWYYLRDAACLSGGRVTQLGYWRGRYDTVTGWTLGQLGSDKENK